MTSVPNNTTDSVGRHLVTRGSLAADLGRIGVKEGDTICAHVSLSSLGYVCGAARAVIEALTDAVGERGTVMMPSFSGELSDPATWRVPPVPKEWIEQIRAETPPYDSALTPTRLMGVTSELLRHRPRAVRSPHPHSSFTAIGFRAQDLVGNHAPDYRFGTNSPLGRLVEFDGKVLMLGAGPERASFIYLVQTMSGLGPEIVKSAPITENGRSKWIEYRDVAVDNRLVSLGVNELVRSGVAVTGTIGNAPVILFEARRALAYLLGWLPTQPDLPVTRSRTPQPMPEAWLS